MRIRRRIEVLEYRQDRAVEMPEAVQRCMAGQPLDGDADAAMLWALGCGAGHLAAAHLAGITPEQLAERIRVDEAFATKCRRALAASKTVATAKLLEAVRGGNLRAIELWLERDAQPTMFDDDPDDGVEADEYL